ncbi:MAG: hypothetical protein AAFU57_08785, partial [Bacteroidota bacterium]
GTLLFSVNLISQENKMKAMPIETDITCEQATKMITNPGELSINEFNIVLAVIAKCRAELERQENPNSNAVSVGYYDEKKDRILFKLIDYKTGEDIKNASRTLVDLYITHVAEVEPISATILYLGADYSIEAFFESAVNDDPMIILAPLTIPGTKLGKDAMGELGRFGKKAEKFFNSAGKKAEKHFKENPEDLVAPGASLTKNAAKETKKFIEKTTGIKW